MVVDDLQIPGHAASSGEEGGRETREDELGGCFHMFWFFGFGFVLCRRWIRLLLIHFYTHVPCQLPLTWLYFLFIKHL